MAKGKDYIRMIHSPLWVKLRHQRLTAHPVCEECESQGLLTPAVEVHHCVPVESGVTPREQERLMFDYDNLRALCHRCHVEAHKAMGRSGKELTKQRRTLRTEIAIRRLFGEDKDPGGVF